MGILMTRGLIPRSVHFPVSGSDLEKLWIRIKNPVTLFSFDKFCQVNIVHVDQHDFEVSDIYETISNRILLKYWIQNMCHVCF